MKKLTALFLCLPFFAKSQDKVLLVEGVSPSLYLTHKVAPKENYYSVGRIYNVSPKDIAPFNKLQLESGLSLGQTIKIPLNSSNFVQDGKAAADETLVPIYYAIKDKEGLYRVAKNHNDLPLETLKQWNNIRGDAVKTGMQLIVGYLKVKTELSSLAKGVTAASPVIAAPEKPAETKPVVEKTVTKPAVEEAKAPVKKEKETKEKAVTAEKTITQPVKETPVAETPKPAAAKSTGNASFKTVYEQQQKNAEAVELTGTAGIFKSTSGWADGKYYCLHNNAAPGTIVKISNPANGKFIFAKVLDNIPDIKQNEGLLIVVSNAAADALAAGETNFNCSLNYAK